MFESLKRAHRFARMGSLWIRVTGLDLRDGGQIARAASAAFNSGDAGPEEAWLYALIRWAVGIPWAEDQKRVAEAMVVFARDPRVIETVPRAVLDDTRFAAVGLLDQLMRDDVESAW